MVEPSPPASSADLPWLADLCLPIAGGRAAGPTGEHAVVSRRIGSRRELAARHGLGEMLGIDLVHAAVNDLLAAGAIPRAAQLAITASRGDALAPAVAFGVARACRGQGMAAELTAATTGAVTEVEVRCSGAVVAPPAEPPREGDVVLALRSSGPTDADVITLLARASELGLGPDDRLPGGDTLAAALLAPRRPHASVLFDPLHAQWPGRRVAVGDRSLAAAAASTLSSDRTIAWDLAAWRTPALFATCFPGPTGLATALAATSLGCGFLVIVAERDATRWLDHFAAWNEPGTVLGRVVAS